MTPNICLKHNYIMRDTFYCPECAREQHIDIKDLMRPFPQTEEAKEFIRQVLRDCEAANKLPLEQGSE